MTSTTELIKTLENEIGERLKKIDLEKIDKELENGFAVDEKGDVIGLNLDAIELVSFPISLSKFHNLNKLNSNHNQLSDISALQNLPNLSSLSLGGNQITDISVLKKLKHLKFLDLRENKIHELPGFITQMEMEIDIDSNNKKGQIILLHGNPLETPPLEIVKKGKNAIKTYFKSLEEGKNLPLNEVKVLLVGDGGTGKTSLVKRLLGHTIDKNEPQTHGINIKPWKIKKGGDEIKVNLWDFGGQEIMHATHQFFLSKRSLYILVLDCRKDEKIEYWLKHIESFGGDSPILVAINKIDENPSFDVNRKFLLDKYKNIRDFFRISCLADVGDECFPHTSNLRI